MTGLPRELSMKCETEMACLTPTEAEKKMLKLEYCNREDPPNKADVVGRLIPSFARIIIPITVVLPLPVVAAATIASVSISVTVATAISWSYRFTVAASDTSRAAITVTSATSTSSVG